MSCVGVAVIKYVTGASNEHSRAFRSHLWPYFAGRDEYDWRNEIGRRRAIYCGMTNIMWWYGAFRTEVPYFLPQEVFSNYIVTPLHPYLIPYAVRMWFVTDTSTFFADIPTSLHPNFVQNVKRQLFDVIYPK